MDKRMQYLRLQVQYFVNATLSCLECKPLHAADRNSTLTVAAQQRSKSWRAAPQDKYFAAPNGCTKSMLEEMHRLTADSSISAQRRSPLTVPTEGSPPWSIQGGSVRRPWPAFPKALWGQDILQFSHCCCAPSLLVYFCWDSVAHARIPARSIL